MTVLLSALTIGLVLSLLALGVYISFRVFAFPDITPDGSITLGACVTATLLVTEPTPAGEAWLVALIAGLVVGALASYLFASAGKPLVSVILAGAGAAVAGCGFVLLVLLYRNPVLATAGGCVAGMLAGMTTGVLHTRFRINGLLSGILVMTALYSVNLRVLGRSNVSLQSSTTLVNYAEDLGKGLAGGRELSNLFGWQVATLDISVLGISFLLIVSTCGLLYAFFRTRLGTAMRATGDCSQMIRALGVNVENMTVAGLALSNGLIALSGSLFAQVQGFADVQMGIGMMVTGRDWQASLWARHWSAAAIWASP